ncbi:MAG: DUF1573 domain-containing protein [Bacteroidaceae bacterium]|nr:DUF1573 domain-containing protein [Bacteroidaceae bacterium]
MKKSLILFCLSVLVSAGTQVQAQTQKHKTVRSEVKVTGAAGAENYAEIKFDTVRVNLGKFAGSTPVRKCKYTFTNTGSAPLIINQAIASCGCTVPNYSKQPVKPGERGIIEVTYDGTGKIPGHFLKTITIRSNARNEVVRLSLEGTMTD